MRRRVVVTGIGVVTPLGDHPDPVMRHLMEGSTAIGKATRFDTTGLRTDAAAELPSFEPADYAISARDTFVLDVWQQYVVAAAESAVRDAELPLARNEISAKDRSEPSHPRYGASVGIAYLSGAFLAQQLYRLRDKGPRSVSPRLLPSSIPNGATSAVSIRYGLRGPLITVSSASAAGADCVIAAYDRIRQGRADIMLAGGGEAGVNLPTVVALAQLGTMSPTGACRPFDQDRDGMVIGEGAAILVLEEYDHARRRGARIHGEILGYGQRGDAYDLGELPAAAPSHIDCLHEALDDAGIEPSDVGYVNVHGTGTVSNDRAEAHAVRSVFGSGPNAPYVSSVKGSTGHMGGGSGAFEIITAMLASSRSEVPPTAGLTTPADDCALRHVIGTGVSATVPHAVSASNGLGGNCSAVVVRGTAGGS